MFACSCVSGAYCQRQAEEICRRVKCLFAAMRTAAARDVRAEWDVVRVNICRASVDRYGFGAEVRS